MPYCFTSELFINAKPEAVWHAIADITNWNRWMPNLVKVEKLTSGDFAAGTKWRETRKMFGKEASEVFEVIHAAPPHALSLRCDGSNGTTGKGVFNFDYSIGPVPQGSVVCMTGNIEMPGLLAGLMIRIFGGMMKKACEKDLHALKKYLEARNSAAAGGS